MAGSTSGSFTPHFLPMTIARLRDQSRRVHRAVGRDRAVELAIGGRRRDAMPERAVHALPLGERDRVLVDGVQHLLVAGEQVILAEEEVPVSPLPGHHPVSQLQLQRRCGAIFRANSRTRGRYSGLPVAISARPLTAPQRFSSSGSFSSTLQASSKIALGLGAIVGRGVAVGPHDPQLELHLLGLARPPAGQLQDAAVGFLLGFLNRHARCSCGRRR